MDGPKNSPAFPTILLLNARSLLPKLDELSVLLSSVKPGFVFITESWLNSDIDDNLLRIPGYSLFRSDRTGRIGGGVCAYMIDTYHCEIVSPVSLCPSAIELLTLRVKTLNLFIVCAYVPPSLSAKDVNDITDFFIELLDAQLLSNPDSNMIVCGDFNTFDTSLFVQQFSLRKCVLSPTRNNSLLDQILIKSNLCVHYSGTAEIGPPLSSSDHNTVLLRCKRNFENYKRLVEVWDFRQSNIDRYIRFVLSQIPIFRAYFVVMMLMKCVQSFIHVSETLCCTSQAQLSPFLHLISHGSHQF